MDNFISSINTIKQSQPDLYITYYLYRVWVKNRNLVEYALNVEDFKKILTLIGLPEEYHELQIVYPLNKFMTSENKDEVEKLIIQQLIDIDSYFKKLVNTSNNNTTDTEIIKQYKTMNEYITENNSVEIIQDKLNQIRKKIIVEKKTIYITNLGK